MFSHCSFYQRQGCVAGVLQVRITWGNVRNMYLSFLALLFLHHVLQWDAQGHLTHAFVMLGAVAHFGTTGVQQVRPSTVVLQAARVWSSCLERAPPPCRYFVTSSRAHVAVALDVFVQGTLPDRAPQ